MPKATPRTKTLCCPHPHPSNCDGSCEPKKAVPVAPTLDLRELMSIVHKRVNVLSGSMVLAFKNGPQSAEFATWADELRTCASQLDRGAAR